MTAGPANDQPFPSVIPVFPLAGVVLMTGNSLPLNIFEPRYLAMVRDAMAGARVIGMVQPKSGMDTARPGATPPIYDVGGAGRIVDCKETEDGRFLIRLEGVGRFRIEHELAVTTPYRQVQAVWQPFGLDPTEGEERPAVIDHEGIIKALHHYLDHKGLSADYDAIAGTPDKLLVNTLSMIVPFSPPEKQALLEAPDLPARAKLLVALLDIASHEDTPPTQIS